MCGRFALTSDALMLKTMFNLDDLVKFPPRYNIAPTQPILSVSAGVKSEFKASLIRWGLMPSWVKDPDGFSLLINGRAETAHEKPSFKNAMRHQRIIIPASGWYEWHRGGEEKQPYYIRLKSHEPILMGGLMETWSDAAGSEVDTGCILTTNAVDGLSQIHHRMPVILKPKDVPRWLDCKTQEPRHVKDLIMPQGQCEFEAFPIRDLVNKVSNNNAAIQEAIGEGELKKTTAKKDKEKKCTVEKTQLNLF